jgi:hypothetical protein
MSNQITIPVASGSLPQGFCPATYQDIANAFAAIFTVTVSQSSGATPFVISATKPVDSTVVWLQLDSLGRPIRIYFFGQGAWLSLHPLVSGLIMPWVGPLPDLKSFDGGDGTSIAATGAASGAMWEVVSELQGKFPVGAGTLPSTAVVNQGDVGGNDKQTIIPDHKHVTGRMRSDADTQWFSIVSPAAGTAGQTGDGVPGGGHALLPKIQIGLDTINGDWTGTDSISNIPNPNLQTVLPPYLGINFLRRTARLYYAVT